MKKLWLVVHAAPVLFLVYYFCLAPLVRARVVASEVTEAVRIQQMDVNKVGKAVAAYLELDGPITFCLHTKNGQTPQLFITSATGDVVRVDLLNLSHVHTPEASFTLVRSH